MGKSENPKNSENLSVFGKVIDYDQRKELSAMFSISWPVAISFICRIAMSMTDLSFIGHLGMDCFLGATLASTFMISCATFVYSGFAYATGVLCAQSVGAKNKRLCITWLQMGVMLGTVLCIPVALAWSRTSDFLSLIGIEDEKQLQYAQEFADISMFWLWPFVMYDCINKYLQAHKIVKPTLVINLIFIVINFGLNIVMIHGISGTGFSGFGFKGSPMATVISRSLLTITLAVYTFRLRRVQGRLNCSWKRSEYTWNKLKLFLKQAIPLSFTGCLEEWQVQLMVILVKWVGTKDDLAAHNNVNLVWTLLYSIMTGLAISTCVRTGHHLGKGNVRRARNVFALSFCSALVVGLSVAVGFFLFRDQVGKLFSSDSEVVDIVTEISILAGITYVCNGCFDACGGAMRGQGRPVLVAACYFVGAWVVTFPLIYLLCKVGNYGLRGVWISMVIGYAVVMVISFALLCKTDWDSTAAKVKKQNLNEDESTLPLTINDNISSDRSSYDSLS
eukprot:TRINITY_DN3016_c0_g1_i4.p1 TRINITY_DN3016_c0_g1~~TRINITY_DN3016_c0_g1_i4.p1  ORF type:complete len:505 (+),score=68.66 TRINITY_DN3016_c0_g1_i4:99-1613(+)